MNENKTFIEKHYDNFKNKNGYIPEMFNPYNESEIKEIAPTLSTQCGSTTSSATVLIKEERMSEINRIDIPQTVKVRKYEVDTNSLKKVLREHKCYTNKQIAEKLNKPLTLVEHWFRNDNSFSIPDSEIWFDLKKLLKIETDEFDLSITTFEEKEGVFEKSNRFYFDDGIAPTLTSTSADEKIIVGGEMNNLRTKNKRIIKLVDNTDFSGKECLFMDIYNQKTTDNMSGTLKSGMDHQQGNIIYNNLRIRKLTPKECWRLMGFTDEEFNRATEVNSNTQLYKQAGNSIVVDVLVKIFTNLFKDNNDYTIDKFIDEEVNL